MHSITNGMQTGVLVAGIETLLSCGCLWLCGCPGVVMNAGCLEYQAQSPDEGALVSAARNFGFVFKVKPTLVCW